MGRVTAAVPVLRARDLERTVSFWVDPLGQRPWGRDFAVLDPDRELVWFHR